MYLYTAHYLCQGATACTLPYGTALPDGKLNLLIELENGFSNTMFTDIDRTEKRTMKQGWVSGANKKALVYQNNNHSATLTKDELLTNIMIYWVTQTIYSSVQTYAKNAQATYSGGLKSNQKVTVPTGVTLFPAETQFPREWAHRKVNLMSFNTLEKGGHFCCYGTSVCFCR